MANEPALSASAASILPGKLNATHSDPEVKKSDTNGRLANGHDALDLAETVRGLGVWSIGMIC
jgi:hypothetical protein